MELEKLKVIEIGKLAMSDDPTNQKRFSILFAFGEIAISLRRKNLYFYKNFIL
jgi:hypothetical protein